MINNKKIVLLFLMLVSLTSCKKVSETAEKYNEKSKYVSIYNSNNYDANFSLYSLVVFYDKDGNYLEDFKFKADTYLSLATDDYIFFYGNKGIISVDRKNKMVEKILDTPSDVIDYENGKLYYVINNGFKKYPHPAYDAKLCKFGGECIDFENHFSFKVLGDKVYMHLNQYNKDTLEEYYVLRVYDLKTKKILKEEPISNNATIHKVNNKIYILDENKKLYEYETKKIVYENSDMWSFYNIFTNYNKDIIIVYNTKNNEETVLYNLTKNKEEKRLKGSSSLYITPYSKSIIQQKLNAKDFIDLSNNKTIEYKDLGKDYIYYRDTYPLD